jgi:aquaporin Z
VSETPRPSVPRWSPGQKYLAEFLGTFGLLLIGGGAAVFTLVALEGAIGTANDLARVLVVSTALGLALMGGIYAFGEISGGHFNPAVTLSMAASGRMAWREVPGYLVAQAAGAILGMLVVAGIAAGGPAMWSAAQSSALSSQCYSASFAPAGCATSWPSVMLIEIAVTFVFVLIIQFSTRASPSTRPLAPVAIGFALLIANLVAIPIDGASINPVRSLGPAVVALLWSGAHWAIVEVWIFLLAPVLGGLLAAAVERALRPAPE